MSIQLPSRAQELVGNPCQEIGDKTGKATLTLTDKASLLRSPLVMVTLCSATMSSLPVGPLAKHSPVLHNSLNQIQPNQIITVDEDLIIKKKKEIK